MDVACFGTGLVDTTVGIIDEVNFLNNNPNFVQNIEFTIGGDALNEAKILAGFGHHSAYVGRVGKDFMGNNIINDLNESGVDTSFIKRTDSATCCVIKLLGKNDYRNYLVPGENTTFQTISTDDFDLRMLDNTKILTIGSLFVHPELTAEKLLPIIDYAIEKGVIVVADMGLNPRTSFESHKEVWKRLDYFFPNYEEASALVGETDYKLIARKIHDAGVKNVIVKLGGDGSYFYNGEIEFLQPVFKVEKVLDTTGAGDTFMGGFISGLLQGRDIRGCMEFAAAAAAITIQVYGASTAIKSIKQVDDFIKENKH